MMPLTLMLAAAILCAPPPLQPTSPDIQLDQVFTPDTPGGLYKHPASITELDNGDLYLAYYGGSGEYGEDTKDFGARLKKGENKWSDPTVIADTPWRAEGNPVVWQGPNGIVWLFYVVRYGDTWSNSRIHFKISSDGAYSWSDSFLLTLEEGMMVRSQPRLLENGDFLLPIYHETGNDREVVGADTVSLFLRHDAKTGQWSETNRIASRLGNLQPSVIALTPEHLICYCRRGGGYDPISDGFIVRAESNDGGRTWSKGEDTNFPNPNAAIDLLRLQNGHLLLVYNDNMNDRTPLTVALSMDNEKTWPIKHNIAIGPNSFAYPYAIQTKDGKIHIIFTSDDRTVINHAVFVEDTLLHWRDK